MSVEDESLYHATQALILPTPRNQYRAHMHAEHWQLRSFISCPKPNVVYYPWGCDIFRLNTATREREIITTLPFTPRCLTASNDWICCGGEDGHFAAICLGKSDGLFDFHGTLGTEGPESRPSLYLDPVRRLHPISRSPSQPSNQNQNDVASTVRAAKFGKEIVNCVTLWFPASDDASPTYSSPVAVLSNNDFSVSIVDLQESEEIDRVELDGCINRAVMSPNGKLLVAVGDDLYMHLFLRKQRSVAKKISYGSKVYSNWMWKKSNTRIELNGHLSGEPSDKRGIFAAEFSPSGRYLAVGTQYGAVSVYDARKLAEPGEDPLIVAFTTTRPKVPAGAVRSMEFSPEPFDLLAWTEDSGRVVIADIRRNFMSRQTIDIDLDGVGFSTVGVIDRSSESVIDPRLRGFRAELDSNNIGPEMERRQTQHLSRETSDGLSPFTQDDTEVLEVLQMERRRREREATREALANTSTPQLSWTDLGDDIRSAYRSAVGIDPPILPQNPLPNLPNSLREFISNRSNESLRAYIRERNEERERRGNQQPRRRGSVILSAAQDALDRESSDIRVPRNAWSELETLYNMSTPDSPAADPSVRLRIEADESSRRHTARDAQSREDFLRLRRQSRETWRGSDERYTVRLHTIAPSRSRHSEPNQTTGCSWSPDGCKLYVGTETGIYEFITNIRGRRMFPSIVFQ